MRDIGKTLALVVTMLIGTAGFGGVALASPDSPFYPDNFKSPSLPQPPVGVGSGIPAPYRLGG